MDLSKKAKARRDAVEDPLFRLAGMLERLELVKARIDATKKVWNETERTLEPAAELAQELIAEMEKLKAEIASIWREGFKANWKD